MPVVNGRNLGVEQNGVFTDVNTDPIPGGRLWPEAALTWNAMRAVYIAGGGHPGDFMPAGPVSSARPRSAQDYFWTHQPPPAAQPYTSNHGWGIAVDVKTPIVAAWLLRNGLKYGWSHDEGARVGEWWHYRYVGAPAALLRQLQKDPLAGYSAAEKRWMREYDDLKRRNLDLHRRQVLVRAMTEQRKRIWQVATRENNWKKSNRRKRYESLLARTR